jgi:DNA polymerase-1
MLKRFGFTSLMKEILPPVVLPVKDSLTRVVLSEEDLEALLQDLKTAPMGQCPFLAVDVETTGLDALSCGLLGIALAVDPERPWYIPLSHQNVKALSLDQVRRVLGPLFSDDAWPKVGQNLKFDLQVLRRYGLELKGIAFDTLLASYCLNPSRRTHNLKQLSLDLLGEAMTPIVELIGKGPQQITMDQVEVSVAARYAGGDVAAVLRLKNLMEPQLKEKKMERLFWDVEMPLVPILAAMEERGIRVDTAELLRLQDDLEGDIHSLQMEMSELAGETLNFNSSQQLGVLLFEKLKLPVIRRTKTGYSTDEEVLQKLSSQHPLPAKVLEYREKAKLKSTYVEGLLAQVNTQTGRVHGRFHQAVTATGRLSSSDPNLQNIPIRTKEGRRIRQAFVPEGGHVFLSADYSQIDLRVLAHMSQDPVLSQAFRQGEDIHAATAREIFGLKEGDSVTEEARRVAKSVNFGIVYGQTPFGLSQQLGIDRAAAKAHIDRIFERYKGVAEWIQKTLAQAREEGCVRTLLNRVRYLPEIKASNPAVRGFAERVAMNTPIQGTSADIIKVAMVNVDRLIREKGWKLRMLLQVHDDLLFEVPEEEMGVAPPLIQTQMERALPLDVPLRVVLKKGENWANLH